MTASDMYFFQHRPTVSFRRVPALGGPSTEFRPWNWETIVGALLRSDRPLPRLSAAAPPGAPPNVPEHTVDSRRGPARGTRVAGAAHARRRMVARRRCGRRERSTRQPAVTTVVTCRVADGACRAVTRGTAPKWSPQGDRCTPPCLRNWRLARACGPSPPKAGTSDGWAISEPSVLSTCFLMCPATVSSTWAPIRAGNHRSGPRRSGDVIQCPHAEFHRVIASAAIHAAHPRSRPARLSVDDRPHRRQRGEHFRAARSLGSSREWSAHRRRSRARDRRQPRCALPVDARARRRGDVRGELGADVRAHAGRRRAL